MRKALALAALALIYPWGSSAFAQTGRDIRFVTVAEVDVRSGPSTEPTFYPTNRLHRGDQVEVISEREGGWLQIRPPEGSFSYISARFLEHISPTLPNHVVTSNDGEVPVYIGSTIITDRRPTVVGVKLKRGAQVVSIGKVLTDSEGAFMPIEAPPGESRFIRAEAVAKQAPGPITTASSTGSSGSPPAGPLAPSSAPSANPPLTPEMLWYNAQQAERNGQTNEAIRLYALVGSQSARSNPNLSAMALQRANYLQGGHQSYGSGAGGVAVAAPAGGLAYPLTGEADSGVRLNPPPGSHTTWVDGTNVSAPIRHDSIAPSPSAKQLPAGWSAYKGRLRPAGRAVEGQKTYVLEMENGGYVRPMAYATGSPGVDLAPWVGKVVEVQGPSLYRGDIRTNYVTAMRVLPE